MNHFSVIGYETPTPKMFMEFLEKNKQHARVISIGPILQKSFLDEKGDSELFFYFQSHKKFLSTTEQKLFCFNPSYKGVTKQNVKNVEIEPDEKCIACARLNLWVYKGNEEYPLLVDLPNYPEVKNNVWKDIKTINITLFPHEFQYWDSQEEFDKGKDKTKYNIGSQTFIPSGTFSINNDPNFKFSATCICGGVVKLVKKKTNKYTGLSFYHLVVDTYAASYDVVVDDKDLIKEPIVNSVILGTFWVCGRIIN